METTVAAEKIENLVFEIKKVIVGQDEFVRKLLIVLLAGGHCIVESAPGLAKTLAVETLAKCIGGTFKRIQFTPDLLPSDIVGTRIYHQSSEAFDVELGPIVANLVLADEINRAPAKVQSAMLEVMAEQQITIHKSRFQMPSPFSVIATQNPIESEGVYPLPEAQRDRFMTKLVLDFPTKAEESEIIRRMSVSVPSVNPIFTLDDVIELQRQTETVYVDHIIVEYIVALIDQTRQGHFASMLHVGVSPRASLALVKCARARAVANGRNYILPEDIKELAADVLRHRVLLSYEAIAAGYHVDTYVNQLIDSVPMPSMSQLDLSSVSTRAVSISAPPVAPPVAPSVAPSPIGTPIIPANSNNSGQS